jgi:hypothetical protein
MESLEIAVFLRFAGACKSSLTAIRVSMSESMLQATKGGQSACCADEDTRAVCELDQ